LLQRAVSLHIDRDCVVAIGSRMGRTCPDVSDLRTSRLLANGPRYTNLGEPPDNVCS
jgi:hypothetical protein